MVDQELFYRAEVVDLDPPALLEEQRLGENVSCPDQE